MQNLAYPDLTGSMRLPRSEGASVTGCERRSSCRSTRSDTRLEREQTRAIVAVGGAPFESGTFALRTELRSDTILN